MRWPLVTMTLVGAIATARAQPRPGDVAPPPAAGASAVTAARPVTIRFSRAVGSFDRAVVERALRVHAKACRRGGASGVARFTLVLRDQPDRKGMIVVTATGARALRDCLRRALTEQPWRTGSLDGTAEYVVRIRVAP